MDFGTTANFFVAFASLITTIILAWLTSRYVRLTASMANAMRLAQEPSVVATVEFPKRFLILKVENLGQSPAFDLSFQVLQDVNWLRRSGNKIGFGSIAVVKNGIAYLAPRQSLRFLVGIIHPKAEELRESHILKLRITYRNEAYSEFHREFPFDFEQLKSVQLDSFVDPVEKLTEALLRIESDRSARENPLGMEMFIKTCPVCGETIPRRARKCSRCLEFIDKGAVSPVAEADNSVAPDPEEEDALSPPPEPPKKTDSQSDIPAP